MRGLSWFKTDVLPKFWRAISALILIGLVGFLLALSWGQLPVMAVAGDSMEPTYSEGDAIVIGGIDSGGIQKGDIIVFDVPASAQFEYGYPETVVHRVVSIDRSGGELTYQTSGDNTGQDPFDVRPENVQGTVAYHIPYFGYSLLYLQSIQGKIFIGFMILVYISYYTLPRLRRNLETYIENLVTPQDSVGVSGSSVQYEKMDKKIDSMENSIDDIEKALEKFSEAVEGYATKLDSHTDAIEDISKATDEIQGSVKHQTKVLDKLEKNMTDINNILKEDVTKTKKDDVDINSETKQDNDTKDETDNYNE